MLLRTSLNRRASIEGTDDREGETNAGGLMQAEFFYSECQSPEQSASELFRFCSQIPQCRSGRENLEEPPFCYRQPVAFDGEQLPRIIA
jgi:hypothetical protein